MAQSDDAPVQTNSIGQKLRYIPAGSYIRGGRDPRTGGFYKNHPEYHIYDEVPRHPVRLTRPFYLATTEVTVGQFRAFVEATGHQTSAESTSTGIVGFDPHNSNTDPPARFGFRKKADFTWKSPGFEQGDDHPVVGVSYEDAQAFCKWLSEKEGARYRLPTEAEWEYACRAGDDKYFSWGDSYEGIHKLANVGNAELERSHPKLALTQWVVRPDDDPGDPHVYTAPVGSYPASRWGMHDMHGNVWEWCQDRYLDTAYEQFKAPEHGRPIDRAIDPLNDQSFTTEGDWRIIRGGSWFTSPLYCRSAIRTFWGAADAAAYLGFRVARDASADEVAAARADFEAEERARAAVEGIVGPLRSDNGTDLHLEYQEPLTPELTRELKRIGGLTRLSFSTQGKMKGELIADIAAVPKLRKLTLWWSGHEGVNDDHLAPLAACRHLEELKIGAYPTLTDQSLKHLTSLTNLRTLVLGGENLTDDGLKQLASLKQLRELDIQGTLSDGSVLDVLKAAPLETLEVRRLTDETAALLKHFPNLKSLGVYDSSMTDAGFAAIAGLKRLQYLTMRNCPNIPSSSFTALGNMHSLTRIDMRDTPFGDEALAVITNLDLE